MYMTDKILSQINVGTEHYTCKKSLSVIKRNIEVDICMNMINTLKIK